MFLKRREKGLRQARMLSERGALSRICALEKDGRFHDVLVCHADPVTMPDLECEAASTYALGLVPDLFHAPAADRYADLRKPVTEGASKLDIARLGAQGLRLHRSKIRRAREPYGTPTGSELTGCRRPARLVLP